MELREVLNYVVAAEEGFTWVQDRPITVGLIEHLQSVLVADTQGERHDVGIIRERQVFIGSRGLPIEDSTFCPTAAGSFPPSGGLRLA